MFRSTTIIRELVLSLAGATIKIIRTYIERLYVKLSLCPEDAGTAYWETNV
jgi:hypothetical protein